MIANKILDILATREPISRSQEKMIFKKGMVTGSSVFGVAEENSDIDIILPTSMSFRDYAEVLAYNQDYLGEGGDFISIYVRTSDNRVLNLLFMQNDEQTKIWRKSTFMMVKISRIRKMRKLIQNKNHRVKLFETLKQIYAQEIGCEGKASQPNQSDILDQDICF